MNIMLVYSGMGVDGEIVGNVNATTDVYPVNYAKIQDYQKQICEHYNIPKCVIINIIPLAED